MSGAEPGLSYSRILVVLVALLFLVKGGTGAVSTGDLVRHWEGVREYLGRYGYLPATLPGAEDLRTEDELRRAIRQMQRFGGVPPTGRIDPRTLQLLGRRRCGMPDIASDADRVRRYAAQGQTWEKLNLTWSIKYFPRSLQKELVRAEVSRAFRLWSDVSLLTFREVSGRADIEISFERGQHGDGYAFDGPGTVLAHAFFPGDGIGGDAHFDAAEPWVDRQPEPGLDGVRLFAVAAHEFGHSLGLSHSSVSGALMNPFYQPVHDAFKLPYDDQAGIQNLYGYKNRRQFAPISPYIPPSGPPPSFRPPQRPKYAPGATAPPPPSPPRTDKPTDKPTTCDTTIDAISLIRRELFVFKGEYFWRLDGNGSLPDYPAKISALWNDAELRTVDAVYERQEDHMIVFFSGPRYWLFNANLKERGYPRPLTDLGLPPDLERVDGAMVWNHNGKTYLFGGQRYWRLDETERRVELDYPRDMAMWRGVPAHVDAVFRHTDSHTYFFKGHKFWKFDDKVMRVDKRQKVFDISEFWFKCPSKTRKLGTSATDDQDTKESGKEARTSSISSTLSSAYFLHLLTIYLAVLFSRTKLFHVT